MTISAPPVLARHKPDVEGRLTVGGFEFLFAGFSPNNRTPAEDAAGWSCPEIKATLIRYGHDSWAVRMHRAEATGRSPEEAFIAAHLKLEALLGEVTRILNTVRKGKHRGE